MHNDFINEEHNCDLVSPSPLAPLVTVSFASQPDEAKDKEVYDMIDTVIFQALGPNGLAEIIKPGYKVVIKVNLVGPSFGKRGEKGRSIITDPRIVRYVAEKVRDIIGFDPPADLKVVDATMYQDPNPSLKSAKSSFHWARLERTGDNIVDPEDFCYNYEANGILDGTSKAQLVNLDALGEADRQLYDVKVASGNIVKVAFPNFLRTKEKANGSEEYCDVFIGIPVFKSHGMMGATGAIKLHYGIRSMYGILGDTGRWGHDGTYYDETGMHCKEKLADYLCAQHLIRTYDFVIMDCLTANRKGPTLPEGGVAYAPNPDMQADYIFTNAIMASKDSVAIDTVEVAFAGYRQNTVKLLYEAARNGIGINDPSCIIISGYHLFGLHRQNIYNQYNSTARYPLEDKWGDARALKRVSAQFTLTTSKVMLTHNRKHYIDYEIKPNNNIYKLDIVRVELTVNDVVVDYKTEGYLCQGRFIFDLNKVYQHNGADVVVMINVWDSIFNCVRSIERFVKPEFQYS